MCIQYGFLKKNTVVTFSVVQLALSSYCIVLAKSSAAVRSIADTQYSSAIADAQSTCSPCSRTCFDRPNMAESGPYKQPLMWSMYIFLMSNPNEQPNTTAPHGSSTSMQNMRSTGRSRIQIQLLPPYIHLNLTNSAP